MYINLTDVFGVTVKGRWGVIPSVEEGIHATLAVEN